MPKRKSTIIDIMGVKYTINLIGKHKWTKDDRDGECDCVAKEINVLLDGSITHINHVLNHEVMHAVFHECGLIRLSFNEVLMDFIASQLPKINDCIEEADKILYMEVNIDEEE